MERKFVINNKGKILHENRYVHAQKEDYYRNRIPEFDTHKLAVCDWNRYAKFSDEQGFDTRAYIVKDKFVLGSKENEVDVYSTEFVDLEKGDILIRYGGPYGHYLAPVKTVYEKLSMPYIEDEMELHIYKVIKKPVKKLRMGVVAENFEKCGKGIQYYSFYHDINELIGDYLEEITESIYRKGKLGEYVGKHM